jgi:hypothetical protein
MSVNTKVTVPAGRVMPSMLEELEAMTTEIR